MADGNAVYGEGGDVSAVISARLPRMTDPLGKHWNQPKDLRDRVTIYATHATIPARDWFSLSNYRSSYPSGAYAGKVWRRGKYLCWYGRPRKIVEHGRTVEVCSIGHARALVQ